MFLFFHQREKKKYLGFQPTPKLRSSLVVLAINKPHQGLHDLRNEHCGSKVGKEGCGDGLQYE